jgi:hypothetical protein
MNAAPRPLGNLLKALDYADRVNRRGLDTATDKSTMFYLKGIRSNVATRKVNNGEPASLVA